MDNKQIILILIALIVVYFFMFNNVDKKSTPKSTTSDAPAPKSTASNAPTPKSTTPSAPAPKSTTPSAPAPKSTTPSVPTPKPLVVSKPPAQKDIINDEDYGPWQVYKDNGSSYIGARTYKDEFECISTDGVNCFWRGDYNQALNDVKNLPTGLKSLRSKWPLTLIDPNNFVDSSIDYIKGYFGGVDGNESPMAQGRTPEECRKIAKDRGAKAWGYRTNAHGSAEARNTCFFYSNYPGPITSAGDGPGEHLTGCINSGEKLKDGCRPIGAVNMTVDSSIDSIKGYFGGADANESPVVQGRSPEDCRRIAKEKGYKAWGHRNTAHGALEWRNTCLFYPNYPGSITSAGDGPGEHLTGCINSGEKLKDGCRPIGDVNMTVDASIDNIKGYFSGANVSETPPVQGRSPEDCRRIAREKGYKAWGHRNNLHGAPEWRNTCFFYPNNPSSITSAGDGPGEHLTGCINSGEKLKDGCRAVRDVDLSVASGIDNIKGYFRGVDADESPAVQGRTPEDCRRIAREKGYKAWGHRNNLHGALEWRNTCFFYSNNPGSITSAGDGPGEHLTGCINEGEKLKDGCRLIGEVNMTVGSDSNYSIKSNIDYGGQGDILGMNDSLINCQKKCDSMADCYGLIRRESDNGCWLKNKNVSVETPNNTLNFYYKSKDSNIDYIKGYFGGADGNESPVVQGRSPEDCRRIAREKGHKAWGHRNNTHGAPEWKNTCFFYPNYPSPITSAGNDPGVHLTGCINSGEKLKDGCRPIGDVNMTVDSSIDNIKGYFGGADVNESPVVQGRTPEDCRRLAKDKGYKVWGHRNATHGALEWRNTCFFYPNIPGSITSEGNDPGAHLTGCINSGEKLKDGCVDMTVAEGINNIKGYFGGADVNESPVVRGRSPEDCRRLAKDKGYKVWGHRNATHGAPEWRNTCFFYSSPPGSITSEGNGPGEHLTGCANPREKLKDRCVAV